MKFKRAVFLSLTGSFFLFSLILMSCGGGGGGTSSAAHQLTNRPPSLEPEISGSWFHPSSLSDNISPDGTMAYYPEVAIDERGNAIIVWHQDDGNNTQIYKSEYRDSSWQHPADLSDNISPDGSVAQFPEVGMDNDDNAIIIWEQLDGTDYKLFKSEYRSNNWTHPSNLNETMSVPIGPTNFGLDYDVAMDSNGNSLIVWVQNDNNGYNKVFKSEYRAGTWYHPAGVGDAINPATGFMITSFVTAAMDNDGNAMIVWDQSDTNQNSNWRIFKSEYRNGAWKHPAGINDHISPDAGQDAYYGQLAMDDNGNAVITWQHEDNNWNPNIFMSEFRNGSWTHPVDYNTHINPDMPDEPYADFPEVAMDNNGNAIVVWEQMDTTNFDSKIYMSEYRNGAWKHPSDTSDYISPAGSDAINPVVDMDNNGNAIIVWEQFDGSNRVIFKSEFRAGTWNHPATLCDRINPDGTDARSPDVSMSDNGEAVIVWRQSDGSNWQIFKSEYRVE